jgi:hypothetical protein
MKKQILLLFLIFTFNKIKAQVPISERDALIDLALSTNWANWNNFDWDTNNPVSTWYGIVVTDISGIEHVTEINLTNNNLNGTIPASIGDFPQLTHLTFWDNQLTGIIPPEIGNNTNLISLGLDENLLTGNIPSELANLTMMGNFWIADNNLEGDISNIYSSWPNLTILGIKNTLLTGDLDLSNNPNLSVLWAENNSLTTINVKNGTNSTMLNNNNFNVSNSSNLICVQVDNENDANNGNPPYTNWSYDNTVNFSENCSTLSVPINNLNNDISFHPNPINDYIFIKDNLNQITKINIYNILGKKIFSKKTNLSKIDISTFKKGVYIIEYINNQNLNKIDKIIKN